VQHSKQAVEIGNLGVAYAGPQAAVESDGGVAQPEDDVRSASALTPTLTPTLPTI
jgi:hypothetical protein